MSKSMGNGLRASPVNQSMYWGKLQAEVQRASIIEVLGEQERES